MDVFRAYRLASFCTVLGGTTMYGFAEPSLESAAVAFLVALAAWVVTGGGDGERARRAIVPRWGVNVVVIIATALMALAWVNETGFTLTGDIENTVSRFSRYLLWLQLIKLFEACRPRDQAHLIALSTMLVVGACLTSVTLAVGMVLVVYLPVLVWTVVLFQMYAAGERVHGGSRAVVLRSGARGGLRRVVFGICATTLLIGAGVFAAMPRGFGEKMLGASPVPQTDYETGFSDSVQLGSAGLISESRRIVGNVQVRHDGTVIGARRHLLRGAVLDEYDKASGRWKRSAPQRNAASEPTPSIMGNIYGGAMQMEVKLRPIPTRYLFTILTPNEIRFGEPTRYTSNSRSQTYERLAGGTAVEYTVSFDEPVRGETQWDTRLGNAIEPFGEGIIREEALGIARDLGIDLESDDPGVRHQMASALANHLGRTCSYTLDMQTPDIGQDPIEMFLEDRKGHCEYFASALAAMCMSIGIEARVVTGFSTEEYDEGKQRHIIRENHAHAWVEARVYPGVWRSFDPSPNDAVAAARAPESGFMGVVRRMREMIEYAWIESVVSYGESSRSNQQEALHSGVLGWLEKHVVQQEFGSRRLSGENLLLVLAQRAAVGVIAGLIAGAVSAAVLILIREPVRRGWGWFGWVLRPRVAGVFVGRRRASLLRHEGAYRRVLDLLERGGFAKPDWCPALAHASSIEHEHDSLGRAVRGVVELYYAERFGDEGGSENDTARADAWVKEVSAFIRARRKTKKGKHDRVG